MKVLWLSMNPGLYGAKGENDSYNGGGWISSLQRLLSSTSIQLGMAFLTEEHLERKVINDVAYYPIYTPPLTRLSKISHYYGGYRKANNSKHLRAVKNIIEEFKPNVIHLFGIENNMADILNHTTCPVIVHLQGLLAPCNNAFWPQGISSTSFLWPFSINEWILRNGYIYAKKWITVRARHEYKLFSRLKYAMGRTKWDQQCTALMAPRARYYHVDEVLRPIFYEHKGEWMYKETSCIQIISTISNTVYKGLDLILKTAELFNRFSPYPFVWKIVGISENDKLIRFFEKKLKIISQDVNVQYLGVLTAEELCEEELHSSMYVHPSYIDNSPNSLCEAQLLGLPCISTYVGGTSSLITHEKDGILIPANGSYELAYYIRELVTNKQWATSLSQEGIKTAAERHDKKKIIEELLSCYKSITID